MSSTVFANERAAHLGPAIRGLTEPPTVERLGLRTYNPVIRLTDGSTYEVGTAEMDGKGRPGSDFVPRRGTVPNVNDPAEPITTPRGATWVRPGGGIVPNLAGPLVIAGVVVTLLLEEFEGEATAMEDLEIIDGLLTLASPMPEAIARLIATKTKKTKTRTGEYRTRIYGYSRRTP
jgi:hypothetical protein